MYEKKRVVWQLMSLKDGTRSPMCCGVVGELADELRAVTPEEHMETSGVLIVLEEQDDGQFNYSSNPLITVKKFIELFSFRLNTEETNQ